MPEKIVTTQRFSIALKPSPAGEGLGEEMVEVILFSLFFVF